jgi:hypothetical protein
MAWASRSGRARVSSSRPEAFGVCQRCGFWYNRVDLRNQMAWKGATLLPTWLFVCQRCYDTPQEQDRAFIPPADPVPIQLPLPEDFDAAETTLMGLTAGATIDPRTGIPVPGVTVMGTTDGKLMGPAPTGRPPGYALEAVMPLALTDGVPTHYDTPVPVISLIGNGTPLVQATCGAPHGLATHAQIVVRGALDPRADGTFSITVLTATVFTYAPYAPVRSGSLLGPATIIVTAQIGLPNDYLDVPQTGSGVQ